MPFKVTKMLSNLLKLDINHDDEQLPEIPHFVMIYSDPEICNLKKYL